MEQHTSLRRRCALGAGFRLTAALCLPAAVAGLSACAHNRTPAPPAPPPKPIHLLTVLPAGLPAASESTGFGAPAYGVVYAPVYIHHGRGSGSANAAAFGAGLLGGLIALAIVHHQTQERIKLMAALAEVNFDARARLDRQVAAELAARQLSSQAVTDTQAAIAIHGGERSLLPAGSDAVMSMEIANQGYYSSMRAGGYSPMLHVDVTLRGTDAERTELDTFTYYADWRDAGGDRRWITTPKALTFTTLDELRQSAAQARQGLQDLVDQFARLIADDVARHASGQARQD